MRRFYGYNNRIGFKRQCCGFLGFARRFERICEAPCSFFVLRSFLCTFPPLHLVHWTLHFILLLTPIQVRGRGWVGALLPRFRLERSGSVQSISSATHTGSSSYHSPSLSKHILSSLCKAVAGRENTLVSNCTSSPPLSFTCCGLCASIGCLWACQAAR